MTPTAIPSDLVADEIQHLLQQGRERSASARMQADLLTILQRQFTVTVEPIDPAFDRAQVLSVRSGEDAWAVNVSLAATYAYILREDASQVSLISSDSTDLDAPEQTILTALTECGFRVLTLPELQLSIASSADTVTTIFALCFQEGGDPFWEFNWFTENE